MYPGRYVFGICKYLAEKRGKAVHVTDRDPFSSVEYLAHFEDEGVTIKWTRGILATHAGSIVDAETVLVWLDSTAEQYIDKGQKYVFQAAYIPARSLVEIYTFKPRVDKWVEKTRSLAKRAGILPANNP